MTERICQMEDGKVKAVVDTWMAPFSNGRVQGIAVTVTRFLWPEQGPNEEQEYCLTRDEAAALAAVLLEAVAEIDAQPPLVGFNDVWDMSKR